MPAKKDIDATYGAKLLKLFRRLMLDGRRHYQIDLASWLNCSKQTVIRLMAEVEAEIGINLESGLDGHKKWYRISSINRSRLGLDFEELRYLAVCRDLAAPYLSEAARSRVDDSIFNMSMLLADPAFANRHEAQKPQYYFFSKGQIDYTPHHDHLELLVQAANEKTACLVQYRAAGREQAREHRFAPGQMVCMNNAIYALGALLTEDFREIRHYTSFAVHRIHDVTLTSKHFAFTIPEFDHELFGLPWHEPKTFRIHFSKGKVADYIRERRWSEKQKIKVQKDKSIILEIVTQSEPELMAWVRSFGEDAEIV